MTDKMMVEKMEKVLKALLRTVRSGAPRMLIKRTLIEIQAMRDEPVEIKKPAPKKKPAEDPDK